MLNLSDFEWRADYLVLSMENSYCAQAFGKLMREKFLIENDPSKFTHLRMELRIPLDFKIKDLLQFIKEYDAFDWNMKCYEETN